MKTRFKFLLAAAAIVLLAIAAELPLAAQNRDAFLHSDPSHKKLSCNSCHKIPTGNWVSARGYPDVADFPGHASCINCHRKDFFAGNRPAICAGCHVSPGPRGAGRFPFPVRSRSQEFATIFPHNVHQDIIAKDDRRQGVAVAHFVNASFSRAPIAADEPQFNNCAICHKTTTGLLPKLVARTPKPQTALGVAGNDAFVPKIGYFKDMPSGHASCFACHYQNVKPIATDCAGCHSLTARFTESTSIRRYSFKFDHLQKEHSVRDCMTCHVRISQNADVKTLKDADVPFMACVSCHNDKITEELKKRTDTIAASQPAFQCIYCHTPEVGRFPVPKSHENK